MPNLALVLSGAVSLGSFEAGVLDELLYTLARLNRERSPEDHFKIDVVTGASAGALTAALVARSIMVDPDARRALRSSWVDDIDIEGLLRGIPDNALLSKDPVVGIAERHLETPADAHPSTLAPERLLLRFMLTNMSGVDYRLDRSNAPSETAPDFVSTFHAEARDFEIHAGNATDGSLWSSLREAAVASGTFPFAFAPHDLPADPEAWPGHAMDPLPGRFTYIDGGLFNNEPLGQAIGLARKLDGTPDGPGMDPGRIFLMVDANLNRSNHDRFFAPTSPLPRTVVRTLEVLLGESGALDWLEAQRVNNEVGWRDELLELLAGVVAETTVEDGEAFLSRLEATADRIVERKRALFPERYPADYRARAVERTRATIAMHAGGMTDLRKRVFATLTFLVNSVAGLDRKDRLNLFVICATPAESAGDKLHAFAGFFERSWREHDYALGRRTANTQLPWVLEGGTEPYPREPEVDYDFQVDLGEVTMAKAPRAARVRLREVALERAVALTRDVAFGPRWLQWATRGLVRVAVRKTVASQVDRMLDL